MGKAASTATRDVSINRGTGSGAGGGSTGSGTKDTGKGNKTSKRQRTGGGSEGASHEVRDDDEDAGSAGGDSKNSDAKGDLTSDSDTETGDILQAAAERAGMAVGQGRRNATAGPAETAGNDALRPGDRVQARRCEFRWFDDQGLELEMDDMEQNCEAVDDLAAERCAGTVVGRARGYQEDHEPWERERYWVALDMDRDGGAIQSQACELTSLEWATNLNGGAAPCSVCGNRTKHGDDRHARVSCQGIPGVVRVRELGMRTIEAAMQTLDSESSGELTRALEGIVGENKWTTLREEWPGFRAHLKEYKFLTRAQLWCEEADALDGAVRPGGEQARHMYYKGVISTTLDKAIKQAERKARDTAKTAAVTRGEECT